MEKDKRAKIKDLIVKDISKHLPQTFGPLLPPEMSLKDIEKMIDEGVEMVTDSHVLLGYLELDMEKRQEVATLVLQVTKLLLGFKIISEGGTMETNPDDYKELREALKKYYKME